MHPVIVIAKRAGGLVGPPYASLRSTTFPRMVRGTADPSATLLVTQGEGTIGLVPRLRRSDLLRYRFPALPGWADVWRSALRALHPLGSVTTPLKPKEGLNGPRISPGWGAGSFVPQPAAGRSHAPYDTGRGDGFQPNLRNARVFPRRDTKQNTAPPGMPAVSGACRGGRP
jgi:hypothetical protein